jgi:glucose-1-phosphate thymidylyltransferase
MSPSKITKGIILAAGAGTRLYPSTFPISKILLPVYDRPMVYYPLFTLMSAGIRDILIITNERDRLNFERTLRDGSQFGVKITYEVQQVQRGIADAFIIGEKFTDGGPCVLILGDNIFHGEDLDRLMEEASKDVSNATVFAHWVPDPQRFGVAEFDRAGNVISLEEKPKEPKSNYAVIGLYFLPGDAVEKAKALKPSARGELEITDLNLMYLREGRLKVKTVSDDTVWMDAGTFDSLLDSAKYVKDMESRRETKILCPEIEALRKRYVTKEQMAAWIEPMKEGDYFKDVIKFMGTM